MCGLPDLCERAMPDAALQNVIPDAKPRLKHAPR